MPFPALVGIPWLASVITGIFGSLFAWFTTFLTKRVAMVAAGFVMIASLTVALFAALEGLVSGLSYALPSEITAGVAMIAPGNLTTCLAIVVSARMLRYAYDWNTRIIQAKLF